MNTVKFWKCKTCKRVLDRSMFPRFFDANTKCADCVTGKPAAIDSDAQATSDVPARVRVQRRHARDNRSRDEE